MGILVLVLLVAAWGLVLGPALLKYSTDPSPLRTEMMFQRTLKALGGPRSPSASGRIILAPRTADYPVQPLTSRTTTTTPRANAHRETAADRRRRNLSALSGFIIVTFLLGWLIQPLRFLLVINFIADLLLLAYLAAAAYVANWPVTSASPTPRPATQLHQPKAAGSGW